MVQNNHDSSPSPKGYGTLHPVGSCANWVAVLETFVSMLLTSFMTGVAFAKLARPHPSIIFSSVSAGLNTNERDAAGP